MTGLITHAEHAVTDADIEGLDAAYVGSPVSRVDGYLKVTGAATYPSDTLLPAMTHAVLVPSRIARGTIATIDTTEATALPGVLAILTHENVQRLHKNLVPQIGAGGWPLGDDQLPLQNARVHYAGEPIAIVVAETLEQATDAASRVRVTYVEEPAETDLRQVLDDAFTPEAGQGKLDYARGTAASAAAAAPVRIEQEYATPAQTNNPLGLFATVASWDGDQLTLYDASQYTQNVGKSAARVLGLPVEAVRVLSPFVGGGFGAGLRAWPHTWRAAIAARVVGRPVKLVLSRAQMFTAVGRRAETVQHIALGAERDGRLVAISHHATHDTSRDEDFLEAMTLATRSLYACPNVETRYRVARVDRSTPTFMRCPGESETLFALESAIDELAIALDMDPIALRLRNEPERDEAHKRPWSSRSLVTCYARGAELFDWSRRTPEPGSMRAGNVLIGLGMASATFPVTNLPAAAEARLGADGSVVVRSAATDIGPGTYTALTQVAADALGLPLARVRVELGDSDFPMSPHQGGSALMASVGSAVAEACTALRRSALALAARDASSPLAGASDDEVEARAGQLQLRADPSRAESYATILARAGQESLQAEAKSPSLALPPAHTCHAFGAQFAEVHIDTALRTIRVPRLVGVFGAGRIVNPKLAESQLMGGMIWGMSQALLEETVYDHRLNRIINASLADYLVPVNADVQRIEVECVPEDDPYVNPLGVKGVGEIGMAGVAAAITNAVYHATGIRIRELPITIEKLLDRMSLDGDDT
jgi:xanthine dehydrogenase YagR molybdenum-binding subunit